MFMVNKDYQISFYM